MRLDVSSRPSTGRGTNPFLRLIPIDQQVSKSILQSSSRYIFCTFMKAICSIGILSDEDVRLLDSACLL